MLSRRRDGQVIGCLLYTSAACDYEKLNELVGQKDAAQAELDALYERWEQLSEEAEG